MTEPRVVAAVLTAAIPVFDGDDVAARVEQAMAAAVQECLDRGVSIEDSATIKAAILEARRRVLVDAGRLTDE